MEHQAPLLGFDTVATAATTAVLSFFKKHPSDAKTAADPQKRKISQALIYVNPMKIEGTMVLERPKLSLRKTSTRQMCHGDGEVWSHASPGMVFLRFCLFKIT